MNKNPSFLNLKKKKKLKSICFPQPFKYCVTWTSAAAK